MSELNLIRSLLGAVYSHVAGDVTIDDKPVKTAQDVIDRVNDFPFQTHLSLKTTDGEIAGFAMHYDSKHRAKKDAELLEPSLVLSCPGDKDEEWYTSVYLVDSQDPAAIEQLVSELNHGTDSEWTDLQFEPPMHGWGLHTADAEALMDGVVLETYTPAQVFAAFFTDDVTEDEAEFHGSDHAVDPPAGLSAETTTLNDATIYGTIPEDVLNLPVRISVGGSQEEKIWPSTPEFRFGDLLQTQLSKHTAGKKNGPCFVTGAVADKKRNKNSVIALYMLGLDVDSGASLTETFAKVQELGLCAVFYTTHSHLSTELRVKQDRFYKWCDKEGHDPEPTDDTVKKFLTEEAKYVDDVIDSAEYVETVHDGTGMHLVISIRPIDKFRIIFPIATPYVIAEQKKSQRDAILHWEGMILGMGALLGISVDRAARDPSRLFFLPRHGKGNEFKIMINGGKALDWTHIKTISGKEEKLSSDPFAQAGAVMGGRMKGRPMSPTMGLDLMTWAVERADGFQISQVFGDYCDDRLRDQTSEGKFTCECPFDDEHSNAGDLDDKGCFIQDAGAYADQFGFRCSHDSCSGRDRLGMLEKAMNDGWFPDSVLTDERYDSQLRDEEEEGDVEETTEQKETRTEERKERKSTTEDFARALTLAENAKQGLDEDSIKTILKLCVDLSQFNRNRIITSLAKNVKVSVPQMQQMFKDVQNEGTSGGVVDDAVYDAEKASEQAAGRYGSLQKANKPVVVLNDDQEPAVTDQFIKTLNLVNRGRAAQRKQTRDGIVHIPPMEPLHQLFRYGNAKVRIAQSADGTFAPEVLTKDIVQSMAKDHVSVVRIVDSQSCTPVLLPEAIAKLTIHDTSLDLLGLDGFATMPYYTPSLKLVTEVGYNEESKRILRMLPEMVDLFKPERGLVKFKPTMDDVDDALNELFAYVFHDFPFNDGDETNGQASRAHFLCMMLQPIVRDLIDGSTPMYMIDKPSAGTGASLLVGSGMEISTGRTIGTTAMSSEKEEVRKSISSNLASGKSIIFFDNVNEPLASQDIANLATGKVWEDRMLGSTEMIQIKNNMQVIFAGNNIEVTDEIMRRMLLIKLDYKDDPTEKREFKVDNLETYVSENKVDLFANLLTIVNYWISQGAPKWKGTPLASFEKYCAVMGGILESIEFDGFLGNRHLTSNANSPDKLAWAAFIQEWISKIGLGKYQTIRDITLMYCAMDNMPILRVNGGGTVRPNEDESRVFGPMSRVIEKQTSQVFRIFYQGEETKVSLKKKIDREKGTNMYAIELLEAK